MRVLGLDLSSRAVGWALLEEGPTLLEWGIIRPRGKNFRERLAHAVEEVSALVERLKPDAVAVEAPVFVRNPKVALKLGGLFWTVTYTLGQRGVEIHSYEPSQVKLSATGSGRASKLQVQRMIGHILHQELPEDAADAAATALSHLHHHKKTV